MNKSFLVILACTLCSFTLQAQDFKDAQKAFNTYRLDPQNNIAQLGEAVRQIKIVEEVRGMMGSGFANDADAATFYQLKGDVYNEIATQILTISQSGMGSKENIPKVDEPALIAYQAFSQAYIKAKATKPPKQYAIKDALKGIGSVQSNLYNMGVMVYEDKKYTSAYKQFNSLLEAHELLTQIGEPSILEDKKGLQDLQYLTGLAAINANLFSKAEPLFQQLVRDNYNQPAIYEALYVIKSAGNNTDPDAAYAYLEAGRKKYPEEASLLFAEINHLLKLNKLDELVGRLKSAIALEPDNVSLYATLGNVYDNLSQRENINGHPEKATEYFDNALSYFRQAINKKPDYFDAYYSAGTLFFNKAAQLTKELQLLENDLSAEGKNKYKEKAKVILIHFDYALPYFQKAEALDPNDTNTLVALKEIYGRKGDLETSGVFKNRLEVVQGGGKNASSYFKK